MSATVIPLSLDAVLMVTTVGGLLSVDGTDCLKVISETVSRSLGLSVSIGVGTGQTAQGAEESAYRAMAMAQDRGGSQVIVIAPDGTERSLRQGESSASPPPGGDTDGPVAARQRDRLLDALPPPAADDQVVTDSAEAAAALKVSERTARRMLTQLATAGLAWPVTATSGDRGRPRQRFRIVVTSAKDQKGP